MGSVWLMGTLTSNEDCGAVAERLADRKHGSRHICGIRIDAYDQGIVVEQESVDLDGRKSHAGHDGVSLLDGPLLAEATKEAATFAHHGRCEAVVRTRHHKAGHRLEASDSTGRSEQQDNGARHGLSFGGPILNHKSP
eukprot:1509500-Prymnesium_polylepis.1